MFAVRMRAVVMHMVSSVRDRRCMLAALVVLMMAVVAVMHRVAVMIVVMSGRHRRGSRQRICVERPHRHRGKTLDRECQQQ